MGTFDWFLFTRGEGPEGNFQTKDFALDLDWYTLDENRRIVYLHPEPDSDVNWRMRKDKSHETFTGILDLAGDDPNRELCARVDRGVVGTFYPGRWVMYAAEAERNRLARKGKRYKPKPKVRYISKAERERAYRLGMKGLSAAMSAQLYEIANRKGFAGRFLERTSK